MKKCSCGKTVQPTVSNFIGQMMGLDLHNCECGSTYSMPSTITVLHKPTPYKPQRDTTVQGLTGGSLQEGPPAFSKVAK